ncbi:MAG: bifunctional DNA-formamidopyrimidine glycosylase/DNA-(apurinic or apyrimidinic site) lyase [Planctomycetaceae bacterium]|nr:bifunctional DNA-formamidopyrimidine glycosylase/DNA-(apurinic or apyrimidinic site) lyase [Planctomycetaceae bacterium]
MPELPEVETMVRGVRRHCEGRTLLQVEFLECTRRPIPVLPSRTQFEAQAGRTITQVGRLGKRALFFLDSGSVMIIEPRMTGLLLVSSAPSEEHRRVCWHFPKQRGKSDTVEFWDRRGLGTLSLLSPDQFAELQQRLGPDALEITVDEWSQRLKKTDRPIKVALLDQSLVAGIGNLYASEILHRSGISPKRKASRLRKPEIEKMADATLQILTTAIRYEGSTLNDGTYRNALAESGGYQNHHQVYDRAGETCPACGQSEIRRIVQAQRSTFYCPGCQR